MAQATITIRLPEALLRAVAFRAEEIGRSRSWVIAQVLREAFPDEELHRAHLRGRTPRLPAVAETWRRPA